MNTRGRNLSGEQYSCLETIGFIVAPWKFDVLKTSYFFKNIKFPRGNYQAVASTQKHYCLSIKRPFLPV